MMGAVACQRNLRIRNAERANERRPRRGLRGASPTCGALSAWHRSSARSCPPSAGASRTAGRARTTGRASASFFLVVQRDAHVQLRVGRIPELAFADAALDRGLRRCPILALHVHFAEADEHVAVLASSAARCSGATTCRARPPRSSSSRASRRACRRGSRSSCSMAASSTCAPRYGTSLNSNRSASRRIFGVLGHEPGAVRELHDRERVRVVLHLAVDGRKLHPIGLLLGNRLD